MHVYELDVNANNAYQIYKTVFYFTDKLRLVMPYRKYISLATLYYDWNSLVLFLKSKLEKCTPINYNKHKSE